jgi:MFS family permease
LTQLSAPAGVERLLGTPAIGVEAAAPAAMVRPGVLLAVVGFGTLMVSMSQTILVPVLPILPGQLHTSSTTVEWLLTVTSLVAAVAVPLLGRLGDMFGKRRLLLVAVGMLVVSSALTAMTDNVPLLMVGRALQGVSIAAVPLGISLLAALLPEERVGSGISMISSMMGVGGAIILPLAGLVAERSSFHGLFWVTAVGGAAAFVALWALVPEAPGRGGGRVDLAGAALLVAALFALLLPLAQTATWGWAAPLPLGLLAAAIVLFAVLGVVELRVSPPLVDLRALRRRPLVLTNLASALFGFALFASLIGTAAYVQAPKATGYGFGVSLVVAGLVQVPSGLGMLAFSPVSARLISRMGAAATLALGAAVVAVGWILRIIDTGTLWEVTVGTTIVGIGSGIGYAAMPSLVNKHTPDAQNAAANGLNTLFRAIGGSVASAVLGSILASYTVRVGGATLPSLTAFRLLFAACATLSVAAAVVALAIPGRRRAPAVSRPDIAAVG